MNVHILKMKLWTACSSFYPPIVVLYSTEINDPMKVKYKIKVKLCSRVNTKFVITIKTQHEHRKKSITCK